MADLIEKFASRKPRFGERIRNAAAGESNPQRDGFFVRSIHRSGRVNPGQWVELTDGQGEFWTVNRESLVYAGGPDAARLARGVGNSWEGGGQTTITFDGNFSVELMQHYYIVPALGRQRGAGAVDACHDAITRALDEACVREPVLRGMALEVGIEKFHAALTEQRPSEQEGGR